MKAEKCVLCEELMTSIHDKHNPWPISLSGHCCSLCNATKVIPARVRRMTSKQAEKNDSVS